VDAGGVIVEVLQTDNYASVNQTALETWVKAYDFTITSVIDSPNVPPDQTANLLGIQEQCWIVDLETMKIVTKFSGSTSGVGTPSAELATPIIVSYLTGSSGG
jgi:hypothetical protein